MAGLVAAGHSNRAITDERMLSERTIEKHVASTLSRLGLTSRAQSKPGRVKMGVAHEAQ